MSTDRTQAPIEVALNVELADELLDQIRAAAPNARITTKRELTREPERLERAEVLFTQQLDPQRVARARSVRWVQSYGAGIEWLLSPEVIARDDLRITNARGIHAQPIVEHVFGLILALARRIDGSILQQQKREWNSAALTPTLRTLQGATLGILGLGAIGKRIAQVGKVFGMRVIGTRRSGKPTVNVDETYGSDGLLKVFANAEYIVNALPLTPDTRKLIDKEAFAQLRPDAVFVNIGRGGTVDGEALVQALRTKRLGAALLDVSDPEPLPADHPLWTLPNVIITPHYAGAHPGYDEHVTAVFVDNLRRYLREQRLTNEVDKRAGY